MTHIYQYLSIGNDSDDLDIDLVPRANSDHVTDSHGRRILEVCNITYLRIGNGRLHNDIHGELTFHLHNGTSTLAYLLLKSNDFQHI